jgi:hypothetical protein
MTDIATLLGALQTIKNNETKPSIVDFGAAVQFLQEAGNGAVSQLGPPIDQLSGSNADVMSLTHSAWLANAALAQVNSTNATRTDLNNAGGVIQQMIDIYNQAYTKAKSIGYKGVTAPQAAPALAFHPSTPATPPSPLTSLAASPSHAMSNKDIATTAGGGVVGFLVGARLAGMVVGGPIGLLAGTALGYFISKSSKS